MDDFDYISVDNYAKHIGKTAQDVYYLIHNGVCPAVRYERGSKSGWLIPKPKDYVPKQKQ